MKTTSKLTSRIGLSLHVVIGAMIVIAGLAKLMGLYPPEEVEKLGPLAAQLPLIAVGEIITAFLLVIQRTSSLGVLLTSAFWGGAICLHMRQDQDYVMPAAFLVLTWVGAYLRDRATLNSFCAEVPPTREKAANESELAMR
jgi:membrane protein insertase Oxa1/YidC/SpoIIIJ